MANKTFILQGFTASTHHQAIHELFDVPEIESIILSVAFVSESGVAQIRRVLEKNKAHVTIFAGIRNDITSYQALRLLFEIGVDLYTVDTGARVVVFHPKVYFSRGSSCARAVIGSANLTLGGLNNNIEASLLLDFSLNDTTDRAVVKELTKQFSALLTDYPENIVKVNSISVLDEMLACGRLADELTMPPPRSTTTSATATTIGDNVPRIKLKVTPIRRALKKAKKAHSLKTTTSKKATSPALISGKAVVGAAFDLVWESKPLTRRDLTIPDAVGTHATGSVNLDKGLLPTAVDHRHYFRDDVFTDLKWTKRSKTVEEAFTKFQLILKGITHGEFDLAVRHTNSTTSAAYKQRNAMTRLSWGPMRELVARPDLIGRTLALYRDTIDPSRFILEID